jgi:very-short-patch-repair endonuclease
MTLERRLFARNLRLAPTDAERRLWRHLRGRRLSGAYFRRQHPVGAYVADFCCADLRLIVEVDGAQHADDADAARDAWFAAQGYVVLRFWNDEVLLQTTGVLEKILATITGLQASRPPP